MSRFYAFGTWFFASLAIALALLTPLTVPASAWADAGSDSGNPVGPDAQDTCPNPTSNPCPNQHTKDQCEATTCRNLTGPCTCFVFNDKCTCP